MQGEIIATILGIGAGAAAQVIYVSFMMGKTEQKILNHEDRLEDLRRRIDWLEKRHMTREDG